MSKKPILDTLQYAETNFSYGVFYSISFLYMTKNSKYSYSKKNNHIEQGFEKRAFDLIYRLTALEMKKNEQRIFYDNIYSNEVNCSIPEQCAKKSFKSVRCGGSKGERLVGYIENKIFYVVFIDFDHSLYDHGS